MIFAENVWLERNVRCIDSNGGEIKLYNVYENTGTFLFLSIEEEEIYGCFWLATKRATSSSAMLLKWCAIYIWHAQFLSEILHWISCPATNDTARLTAWHESPFLSRKESRSLKSFSKDFEIEELIYDNWKKKKKKKTIPCSTRSWRIYPKLALKRDDDNAPLKKKSIEPPSEILSLSFPPLF